MALAALGAVFLFFLALVYALGSLLGRPSRLPLGEKVAVVEVEGVIESSKETIDRLIDFRDDETIKAIVLRIDSPGGGVGPSQEIYEEVRKAAEIKPLVVSMGSVAASGGYYIAVPAQRIVANPGTITGSIGVIMEFANFQELLDKIGLKSQVVKSGEHKDIGSPTRPMTEEDRRILQSLIDDVHQQFIAAVAEGRNLSSEKARALADGRIFSGRQAQQYGLVDELGNLQDAVATAASLAGIEGEPKVVYPPPDKPDFFRYLVEESASQLRHGLQQRTAAGLSYVWSGIE